MAQARGDYDAALDWYRQALAIFESLGDRAGMASSVSQIGVLFTETQRAAAAVPWNLRGLALHLEMHSPQVRIDLHWLSRQRQLLGDEAFRAAIAGHLDFENTARLFTLLDGFERQGEAGGTKG